MSIPVSGKYFTSSVVFQRLEWYHVSKILIKTFYYLGDFTLQSYGVTPCPFVCTTYINDLELYCGI